MCAVKIISDNNLNEYIIAYAQMPSIRIEFQDRLRPIGLVGLLQKKTATDYNKSFAESVLNRKRRDHPSSLSRMPLNLIMQCLQTRIFRMRYI